MSLISVLTATFNKFIIFSIIIFVHEFGHFLSGVVLNWNVDRIYIYPYGGCTKFNNLVNTSMTEEFIVLISGPIFQILFYIIFKNNLRFNDYIMFRNYNYAILIFNLLPVYPLDGGRLINLFYSLIVPYKKSLYFSLYLSFVVISILFFKISSLSFLIVILFLIIKIVDEYKNIDYSFNKFLLERYLYKFKFKKTKIIRNDNFYRSKNHIVIYNGRYYSEEEYLEKKFN